MHSEAARRQRIAPNIARPVTRLLHCLLNLHCQITAWNLIWWSSPVRWNSNLAHGALCGLLKHQLSLIGFAWRPLHLHINIKSMVHTVHHRFYMEYSGSEKKYGTALLSFWHWHGKSSSNWADRIFMKSCHSGIIFMGGVTEIPDISPAHTWSDWGRK